MIPMLIVLKSDSSALDSKIPMSHKDDSLKNIIVKELVSVGAIETKLAQPGLHLGVDFTFW